MADSVLIVPPFLKSVSGPLLGPAMLAGAASARGHRVVVADLNAAWIRERLDLRSFTPGAFIGDHDRPGEALRHLQREFSATLASALPAATEALPGEDPALTVAFEHAEVREAAMRLARNPIVGGWVRRRLSEVTIEPDVVGVSVMYSGQVLFALATTLVSRNLWPRATVIWGGTHVTALREQIAHDSRFGWVADRFVVGHAELSFVEVLDAIDRRAGLPETAVTAGARRWIGALDDASVVPAFDVDRTDWPRPTLPAQASRGCAYGRCSFCTYPAIEGRVRNADDRHLLGVVKAAAGTGAAISLKDSLVLPPRLEHVARLIDGRTRWSACTKLHSRFDAPFAKMLAASGCATVEVGLETLTPDGQLLFDKRQTPDLFLRVTDALADAGVAVVVNYMTGLPGVERDEQARWLAWVQEKVVGLGALGTVEHNTFQLERLSPMGREPGRFGLNVTRSWPWASVMAWEQVEGSGRVKKSLNCRPGSSRPLNEEHVGERLLSTTVPEWTIV